MAGGGNAAQARYATIGSGDVNAFKWVCALLLATAVHAEVPLRRDATGHVVVPTMIEGTGPVDFIMDTGADETGVYGRLAKRLTLPATGSTELGAATGSAQSVQLRVSALSVDGHEIDNFLADTLADRPDAAQLGVSSART
jgi:predicted aspartyl protease